MKGLLKRLLPGHEALFQFELSDKSSLDSFTVSSAVSEGNGKLVITVSASSGVALASGLYWYLQQKCNSSVSWYFSWIQCTLLHSHQITLTHMTIPWTLCSGWEITSTSPILLHGWIHQSLFHPLISFVTISMYARWGKNLRTANCLKAKIGLTSIQLKLFNSMVGLEAMGERDWLDGVTWNQRSTSICRPGVPLAAGLARSWPHARGP